ncbi:hypothetical protein AFLA70_522g000192 [Aspergillus flavus AF70]|nr:hypothetical protein AFLA70_522g000192 [Aspergillus flavus AF70]
MDHIAGIKGAGNPSVQVFCIPLPQTQAAHYGFEHLIMDQATNMAKVFTASTDLQGEKKFITIVCTTASCIM